MIAQCNSIVLHEVKGLRERLAVQQIGNGVRIRNQNNFCTRIAKAALKYKFEINTVISPNYRLV